jgi:O-succinylbenzoate synthase
MDSEPKLDPISRVDVFIIRLPLGRPFTTSFGTETHKEALLIKLSSSESYGWGECVASPAPYYSYETNDTALWVMKHFLIPILKTGRDHSIKGILNQFKQIRGHYMAKATVENALLDLQARRQNRALYEIINGKHRQIMSGISIGIKDSIEELLQAIEQATDRGYHRIKIKIKRNLEMDIIGAVRHGFPSIKLMADANADYTINDLELLKQLDPFDLMMIEQPLEYDDLYFHSQLQRKIKTPICLDESIKNLNDAKAARELNSCRIINIKQGRVGGILSARLIQEYCLNRNIDCWSGGMLETGIGRAFNLHLQTLPGFTLPGDTSETSRYFHEDIVDKPVVLNKDGFIDIPTGPGTGVEVIPEKLKKFTIFSEQI